MRILVVNVGSSSLKHALVDAAGGSDPAAGRILDAGTERWEPGAGAGRHAAALHAALGDRDGAAAGGAPERPDAIAHRIVHGGDRFHGPVLVDDAIREQLAALAPLAPLHTRAGLEGLDAAREAAPGVPQIACFDTAFHRTLAPEAQAYALPRAWTERFGLRRYGFHGLNVAWCAGRAAALLGAEGSRRLVVAHLGSGCSVTAVRDGRSVETTMGLTPLDGVPMATRSGAVDPGLLLYLLAQGIAPAELDHGLNHDAGLLGLSGRSSDLREIESAIDADDPRARLAFDVLSRGVASAIAAMTTTLGGLDALVFTAGMGEHSPRLRAAVAARLAHLGVALDPAANAAPDAGASTTSADVAAPAARIRTLVVPAGEELVIAGQARDLLASARRG